MGEKQIRVCVIGAGPSGMSVVKHFSDLDSAIRPEVVCLEKQDTWCGLWNFSWRTGTDEYGDLCHHGMYKNLLTNTPKEMVELPDYTFDEHLGSPSPSFLTRKQFKDYLEKRWQKYSLKKYVRFNNIVRGVKYLHGEDKFRVTFTDRAEDKTHEETFTHVVVANGIHSAPNKPDFPGLDTFPGSIIHAHDPRDISLYRGQSVLAIGICASAHDVALWSMKYGAAHATVCWHNQNLFDIPWPAGITVHPMVERVDGNVVHFKDGASEEYDAIVLCTGYQRHLPFMEDELRLKSGYSFYPENLYKGVLFLGGGNNKLFYMGAQAQFFSLPLFDVQGLWICRYILGTLDDEPASIEHMEAGVNKWLSHLKEATDFASIGTFQLNYICDLAEILRHNLEAKRFLPIAHDVVKNIFDDIVTCRDKCFCSIYTGTMATKPEIPWMEDKNTYI